MVASFTPLQPTLGIVHGDLRLVCGCSTMETNFMKLATNSSCADVASRGSLELCSVVLLHTHTEGRLFLRASALSGLILLACLTYYFVAELLLLLDVSTSQYQHL